MKKIKYLFIIVLSLCFIPKVNAAGMSISANKKTVTVGSSVTVTVSASSVAGKFNVISSKVRAKIRTFLEGIINPLGGVIAGLVILFIQNTLPSSEFINYHIPLFGLVCSIIWLFCAFQLRFFYFKEMKKSFKINKNNDRIFIKESLRIEKNAKRKKQNS